MLIIIPVLAVLIIILPLLIIRRHPNLLSPIRTAIVAIVVSVLQVMGIFWSYSISYVRESGMYYVTHDRLSLPFGLHPTVWLIIQLKASAVLVLSIFLPLIIWAFYFFRKKKNLVALVISTDIVLLGFILAILSIWSYAYGII